MNYPEFFNTIKPIKLKDELSNFLGTFEDGIIEFTYLDVVKAAGHSCPTVAGAYLLTLVGLEELYKNELPKRGEIFVSFKEDYLQGTAGVVANVVSLITGATADSGFKGLNNQFKRFGLMRFNDTITSSIMIQRIDNGKSIELMYDPSSIKTDPNMATLMQKMIQKKATDIEKIEFGRLWQSRVEKIFNNTDKVIRKI